MNRQKFLGSTDLGIVTSLLTNYNVPTKIADGIKLNKVKHQDNLLLIELGTLLTSHECDELVNNIRQKTFEEMSNKYDVQKRTSSRLVVMDDRLARTLWRRLKFSNKLTKLVHDTHPLGFNVQGQWKMSGVNPAMRLNKYQHGDHFAPHKDAQYAPSGDERSLLSLLIYLNEDYEHGETKFYFPRHSPKSDVKGLTIAEEIEAYDGLKDGFECITLKPKKGFAVLFTHNLLHEAVPPEMPNSLTQTERLVLRTDVLVKREGKSLGFAISSEEKDDYLACLNFFREAQQNELKSYESSDMSVGPLKTGELYERALSIRYCYPHLLRAKLNSSIVSKGEEESLVSQLPPELWLRIFKCLREQDIQHLIFAFPKFQLLKIVWDAQEARDFVIDPSRPKFIPTIRTQYGSRTLFHFGDSEFFYRNIDGCCRVAAVYAFFLLGHAKDSTTYIVRYDRNTQEVCEVQMERVLADAFYNRNCYGSLYRVKQKDEKKRQPLVDFDHSVDRTYLTNRHQSQFLGQDLLSRFHLTMKRRDLPNLKARDDDDDDGNDDDDDDDNDDPDESELLHSPCNNYLNQRELLKFQRRDALIEQSFERERFEWSKDPTSGYCKHLLEQTEQDSGTSVFRMISATEYSKMEAGRCRLCVRTMVTIPSLIHCYNHLIFDFDTHQLTVECLPSEETHGKHADPLLNKCVRTLKSLIPKGNSILSYRVSIEQLARQTKGFNHASCECAAPTTITMDVDQFSFLDYSELSHVYLAVAKNTDHVFVLATYGGIVAF